MKHIIFALITASTALWLASCYCEDCDAEAWKVPFFINLSGYDLLLTIEAAGYPAVNDEYPFTAEFEILNTKSAPDSNQSDNGEYPIKDLVVYDHAGPFITRNNYDENRITILFNAEVKRCVKFSGSTLKAKDPRSWDNYVEGSATNSFSGIPRAYKYYYTISPDLFDIATPEACAVE